MLKGFGFSGYRSIGDEMVFVAPLKKINFIIGQNNSGKSNVISFLNNHLVDVVMKASAPQHTTNFTDIDRHVPNAARVRVAFPFSEDGLEDYLSSKVTSTNQGFGVPNNKESLKKIVSQVTIKQAGFTWFIFESSTLNAPYKLRKIDSLQSTLSSKEWQNLLISMTNFTGGGSVEGWVSGVLDKLSPQLPNIPQVEFIPAIRQIGTPESTFENDYSGKGIIQRLADLQNPTLTEQGKKEKFKAIQKFLRIVLENDSATIEIPHDRKMILIHMDGKTLPLESLGTGIHEVIILAAAATVLDDTILCIEEPELHIHPLLQRKLIQYLSEETNNQYFFTTHSAHLLETEGAEIFHVRYDGSHSTLESVSSSNSKSSICRDLGYKASDILQANCIIWVEGPSDRIYINNWIKYVDSSLVEGIHYSIMFFGGRTFSHLTAEDENDIEDFISVRKLNRNACIVFDSDKNKAGERITGTKARLKREFNEGVGCAWVTQGREIENYIDIEIIDECVQAIHPSAKVIKRKTPWSNLLKYKNSSGKTVTANKVKVARFYVENYTVDLGVLDLKAQINKLISFIKSAN